MRRALDSRRRIILFAGLLAAAVLLPAPTSPAAVGPRLRVDSISSTTAQPGQPFEYLVQVMDTGDVNVSGEVTVTGTLPSGMKVLNGLFYVEPNVGSTPLQCEAGDGSSLPSASDPTHFKCTHTMGMESAIVAGGKRFQLLVLTAEAELGALGETLTPEFTVQAEGDALTASTVDPTPIAGSPPGFGIAAFDNGYLGSTGEMDARAGAHPADLVTSFDLNSLTDPRPFTGAATPVAPARDVFVALPPGFVGDPNAAERCSAAGLAHTIATEERPQCPSGSQVGSVVLRMNASSSSTNWPSALGPVPVFNLEPPVGAPARFGFNVLGTVVVLDTGVRSDGDYGITTASQDIPASLPIAGTTFDFWGTPAAESHHLERACPGDNAPFAGGPICAGAPEPIAFLRNPTSCEGPQASTIHGDSWLDPGVFSEEASLSHRSPGYPYAPQERGAEQGFEECAAEPFSPSLEGGPPGGAQAGEPSGFSFDLKMPQQGLTEPAAISESDLKKAAVTLPAGVRVNPASAGGLGSCSPEQAALTTPIGTPDAHFRTEQTACPEDSKIGTLRIKTPLLDHEIPGAVYLAQPEQNPFGSLIALYLVAKDPISGVNIVLPGKVNLDPSTGQITTTFDNNPQLPFEDLHLELKSGPRAALVAPSACGTYTTHSTFTGWSGKEVEGESSFSISEGCAPQGFSPKLSAGTENPLAGQTSPFSLRLTREDGEGELSGLTATLPPGLSGYLRGIPYCPDSALASISEEEGTGAAQEANPSCPALSRVGTVTVGAGAGSNPFYTQSGRAYLAGPYKGAPLSLAVIAPAVAGPFDLGSVLVRNALQVNPETAQITAVSDPFPTILHGIPLDLRDVRVELNRPHFTLNPTSCDPMSVNATLTSAQGQSASPSQRFQAAGCDRLAFKPKLSLRLRGKTARRAHPALRAVLTMPAHHQANIARAQVTLPHAEFLDQGHIRDVCTQVQFKGTGCPQSSSLGHAKAISPLLDQPLSGPVYLMSGFGHKLPDIAADLNGQIRVLLHGKVDTGKSGGIRTTFEVVPDAPVTKFVLSLKGGSRGLIQNSENICRKPQHALALLDAHNGRVYDTTPKVQSSCKSRKSRHRGAHR